MAGQPRRKPTSPPRSDLAATGERASPAYNTGKNGPEEVRRFNAAAVRVGGLATRQRKPARVGWSGEGVIVGEHEAEVGESSLADGVARDTL